MKALLLCVAVCAGFVPVVRAGGGPSTDRPIYVPTVHESTRVIEQKNLSWVSLRVPVDAYVFTVLLHCTSDNESDKVREIERADQALRDNAPKGVTFVEFPMVDLMPDAVADADGVNTSVARGAVAISRGIVVPATKTSSPSALALSVREFLRSAKLPKNVEYELRGMLAVVSKQQAYRTQLLTMVSEDVKQMRKVFGDTFQITIEGLQTPLRSRLVSDHEAELLLDYKMTLEMK